jgi:hypothetical protein
MALITIGSMELEVDADAEVVAAQLRALPAGHTTEFASGSVTLFVTPSASPFILVTE